VVAGGLKVWISGLPRGRFRSFDLTFESYRSTHTILKYLAALWEMPSLLDSQGVFECKEAVRQPHH
jgi:hypothetical protein